jgi:hypothetical protein
VLTGVVQEWNVMHSAAESIVLQAIKWETHAHPASGDRPQALINKQIVDDSDVLIAVFWSRLGTPTGVARSGTDEEIERLRREGKHILLYFSTARLPQDFDQEQWQLLQEYKRTLKENTLYWDFPTLDELHRIASRHLATVIHELADTFSPANSILTAQVVGIRLEPRIELQSDHSTAMNEFYNMVLFVRNTGDRKIGDFRIDVLFPSIFLKQMKYPYEVENGGTLTQKLFRATSQEFGIELYPGDESQVLSINYVIEDQIRRFQSSFLDQLIEVTVRTDNMTPSKVSRPVSDSP